MLLSPSKEKHRKVQKGRIPFKVKAGFKIAFGEYALKSLTHKRISAAQIEAARKSIMKLMERKGKLWIKVFPDIPVSKKPAEVRMGKGKGSRDRYVFKISPGRILFELDGVSESIAELALTTAANKLPIKTKFIKRYD